MRLSQWLRQIRPLSRWKSKLRSGSKVRRFVRRLPLSLEGLESRIAPATDTWIGPASGYWDVGSNWSTGSAPGPSDTAIINPSPISTLTITIQSGDNIQVQNLTLGSGETTLSIAGGSLTVSGDLTILDGSGMLGGILYASGSGSNVTVNGKTTLGTNANLTVTNGAIVSLPGLTSVNGPTDGMSDTIIIDTNNGTLRDNNLTSLNAVAVRLDGTDRQVANSWTTFTNGELVVAGGSCSLPSLTNVDGSILLAENGGTLALPSVLSYTGSGTSLRADGSGSVLSMPALTSVLNSVTGAQAGPVNIEATNGGTLQLTGLASISGNSSNTSGVWITDTGNSTLEDGNLTNLDGVFVTLDGTDRQAANSWNTLTNGSLTVTGGSYTLPGLRDLDGSSLYVESGGQLALPGLTSYSSSSNTNVFVVYGTGGLLDVSALTNVTNSGAWYLCPSEGGTLKLTGLTSLNNEDINIDDTPNGTLLLNSNVSNLNAVDVTLDGTDTQLGQSWTAFTNGTLSEGNGSCTLAGLTDIQGSTLIVLPSLAYASQLILPDLSGTVGQSTSFSLGSLNNRSDTFALSGSLPNGISFTSGLGTGTLSGTPAAGTAGTYQFTITASHGSTTDGTINITLTIAPAPPTPPLPPTPTPPAPLPTPTPTPRPTPTLAPFWIQEQEQVSQILANFLAMTQSMLQAELQFFASELQVYRSFVSTLKP